MVSHLSIQRGSEATGLLPPSADVLHSGRRNGLRRAGHRQAIGGVDDRDGVARPGGGGCMQL